MLRGLEAFLLPVAADDHHVALPVLYGDRPVARVEPKMDRETTIDEGKTLWDDWAKGEEALREASDDEELGNVEAEHIQEEMEEERLERGKKE